ncbi:MAG: dephospho-CoA kinase [Cytophagales bacterium]|nr:dephospho-CoA kinase [Cytophagales bacterium]
MKPLQVGITGGIGSGKSLVCKIFNALGVPSYDADSRAKSVMTTDGILVEQIKKEFGTLSYDASGVPDRKYLAAAVFNNPQKLAKLNELVHPRVVLDYAQWLGSQANVKYVLKEAALLVESGSYKELDYLVLVSASVETRIARVLGRDAHRTRQDVEAIITNQSTEETKLQQADFVIHNNNDTLLIPQVVALHQKFSALPH